MYFCLCNVLTEQQVQDAIRNGARDPDDVYAHHSCVPACEQCPLRIQEMVERQDENTRNGAACASPPALGSVSDGSDS